MIPWWALLAACTTPAEETDSDEVVDQAPTLVAQTVATDVDGRVRVTLDVPAEATHLQVAASGPHWLRTEAVTAPDGTVVAIADDWNTDHMLSGAFFWAPGVSVVGWPVLAEDGPLQPGLWTVDLAVTDDFFVPMPDVDLTLTLGWKADPDPTRGAADVVVRTSPGVAALGLTDDVMDDVVAIWADHGLDLRVVIEEGVAQGGAHLVDGAGWSGFLDATPGALNVWLLDALSPTSPGFLPPLASTGTVPLGLVPSNHSGIAIGVEAFGQDATAPRIALTVAHELGHGLGLAHPVAFWSGTNDVYQWDAVPDTVECTSRSECAASLGSNLLYPEALPTVTGRLTDDQVAVAHGWLGAE